MTPQSIGLVVGVLGVLAIAAATVFGPRVGIAAPLVLVVLGIAVGLIPAVPEIPIDPEWLLLGVLPPLLYSSSVSMPAMNFRREFGAIGGLSVVLVIASSLLLGLFFSAVIPGLPFAWGVALGAVVSPTDAVATGIIKKLGVSPRVVSILEGESLLNDATALVILKSAIAAVTLSFSAVGTLGSFAYSVVVALVIGFVVGKVNLVVRARVSEATVNTVIGFAVPFIAALPAESLGASGLVAAVVAGLVTGRGAPRKLSAQHRLSDSQNWRTVELVLEGGLFLTMGLQMSQIVTHVSEDSVGVGVASLIAAGAFVLTLLVRALYVGILVRGLKRRATRLAKSKDRFTTMQGRLDRGEPLMELPDAAQAAIETRARWTGETVARTPDTTGETPGGTENTEGAGTAPTTPRQARLAGAGRQRFEQARQDPTRLGQLRTRLVRALADIEYYLQAPLGWKEGTVLVWAGMRGAVTLAAAQTLPEDGTPHRSLLVFIAFAIATGSLLLQGGTIGALVRWIKPASHDAVDETAERTKIMAVMKEASAPLLEGHERGEFIDKATRLAVLDAQRNALLDARDDGTFDAEVLQSALIVLDADQISIDLRGGPPAGARDGTL